MPFYSLMLQTNRCCYINQHYFLFVGYMICECAPVSSGGGSKGQQTESDGPEEQLIRFLTWSLEIHQRTWYQQGDALLAPPILITPHHLSWFDWQVSLQVDLSMDDIETILNTLIFDGKVEMTVIAAKEGTVGSVDGQMKLYRGVNTIIQPTGLVKTPCGLCPVTIK